MNMNYIWKNIRDFHYEHREMNWIQNRNKKSIIEKFSNSQKKYISGVTFKHFKFSDLQVILDVLRGELPEDQGKIEFVETRPDNPSPNGSDGTQPVYEYRYKMTKPLNEQAVPNVSKTSGAEATGTDQTAAPARNSEPAATSEMTQGQA